MSPQEARRRAKEQAATKQPVQTYVFTDDHNPHLRPNSHGYGGVKPFLKNGKWCMVMTEQQAKFWLDNGAIAPEKPAGG
jgi:hypothetical protein